MSKEEFDLFDPSYGIHTIELYLNNLKYTQVQKVSDYLFKHGRTYVIDSNEENIDRSIKSTYFIEDGIRLRIYQSHNKSNGIGFIINPSTLLMKVYMPLALWIPSKGSIKKIKKRISNILQEIGLRDVSLENLSLSQMDLTRNVRLMKTTDTTKIIHSFRKGDCPRHFKEITYKDKESKKYLFEATTNRITFKVYDKIYELKKYDRCPPQIENDVVIRLEVSLKREAFLKRLPSERTDSLFTMLRAGYDKGNDIIDEYIKKFNVLYDEETYYNWAVKRIKKNVDDASLRKPMLYFFEKLAKYHDIDSAQDQMMVHYKNVDDQQIKKMSKQFSKLKINPGLLAKK